MTRTDDTDQRATLLAHGLLLNAMSALHPNPPMLLDVFLRHAEAMAGRLEGGGDRRLAQALRHSVSELTQCIPAPQQQPYRE